MELDYRNKVAAELALIGAQVVLGGSEFMARLMVDEVLLARLPPSERERVIRRVRSTLSVKEVSEALQTIRDRAIEEAKRKR